MSHEIVKVESGYECRLCGKQWKGKNPQSSCVGVWIYESQKAPENLKTEAQLKKMGLKPGGPRVAVVGAMEFSLFDIHQAVAIPVEEIAAEKERKRKERHAARYRTCKHCKKEVKKEKYSDMFKACPECLPACKAEYQAQLAAEEAEQAKEQAKFLAKCRDEAIEEARAWLALGDQAVILDTETTGLDWRAEVVQIGVLGIDGSALMDCLVKPVDPIPADAMRIHGITNEMVAAAPAYPDYYTKLCEVLKDKTVIVYNAQYDRGVLRQSGQRYGQEFAGLPVREWVCAMETYAAYYGEWSEWHRSFRWQRLTGGDHSAIGDCRATLKLLQVMAESKLSSEVEDTGESNG